MTYILIGFGGICGSLSRFILGKYFSERSNNMFPIGTFIINIAGAFLLGIITALQVKNNIYLLIGDGFLGAFTTFSTFMYEGFNLFQDKEKLNAFTYILGTIILGIVSYCIGILFVKVI